MDDDCSLYSEGEDNYIPFKAVDENDPFERLRGTDESLSRTMDYDAFEVFPNLNLFLKNESNIVAVRMVRLCRRPAAGFCLFSLAASAQG